MIQREVSGVHTNEDKICSNIHVIVCYTSVWDEENEPVSVEIGCGKGKTNNL